MMIDDIYPWRIEEEELLLLPARGAFFWETQTGGVSKLIGSITQLWGLVQVYHISPLYVVHLYMGQNIKLVVGEAPPYVLLILQ